MNIFNNIFILILAIDYKSFLKNLQFFKLIVNLKTEYNYFKNFENRTIAFNNFAKNFNI